MSSSSAISGSSSASTTTTTSDAFDKVDLDSFLKLLVTELQNQDPMEPMKNSEILQQVSQIKAIESNQRLSDTLTSVSLQQSLSTGGGLLQKTVTGLTDSGDSITGKVESVSSDGKTVRVNIGENSIKLSNITEITPTN